MKKVWKLSSALVNIHKDIKRREVTNIVDRFVNLKKRSIFEIKI